MHRWLAALVICGAAARLAAAQTPPAPEPSAEPPPPTPTPTPNPTPTPEPSPPPLPPMPAAKHSNEPVEQARLIATARCLHHEPDCDWLATLTKLERQSVVRALAARHHTLDPMPWGKRITKVDVYNEKVFAEGGSFIEFFNHFHVVTSERAIRDELTITAGEIWDQDRVDESARRLHDPLYSSVVAAVPVDAVDGTVVLFVVTRDIFSIRLNTNYNYQGNALTNLQISLSDNNFLGTRDLVAAGISMDEGSLAAGPVFLDKNLAATHIVVNASGGDILTRQALPVVAPTGALLAPPMGDPEGIQDAGRFHSEGTYSSISVSKPLWALASEWAWGLSFAHTYGVTRNYEGSEAGIGLRSYVDPDDGAIGAEEYELHRINTTENVTRQWGVRLKQQLNFGHFLSYQAPFFLPSFPTDPTLRADFAQNVMPPKQTDSALFVEYSFFEPRYATNRNIQTYDLAEDVQYGGALDTSVQVGPELLGSTHDFVRPSLSLSYTLPWARDGSIHGNLNGSIRWQEGTYIDNTAQALVRVQTPSWWWGRLVLQQSLFTRWHDTQNTVLSLGSDSALRGYNVAELFVDGSGRILSGQFEARSNPIPLWVLRLGLVAFYELGAVNDSVRDLEVFDDVGAGVRALIPQTSRLLFRFDFAMPLRTDPIPGGSIAYQIHFVAGFDSYF